MNNFSRYNITDTELLKELKFRATRSSGKGGQNVNKVSTRITLIFELEKSAILNEDAKKIIRKQLKSKINLKGQITFSVSKERYQSVNKSIAIKKFIAMIDNALELKEIRIKTKPGLASKEKRLSNKANIAAKKKLRAQKPSIEE